jgi:hypothetical protein
VGLLPDQVPPEGMGVWAPFFGQPAYTMTLAARLVQQTGAAVLPAVDRAAARRRGYVVREHAPAEPCRLPRPMTKPLQRGLRHHRQPRHGALIRRCPQQYLWGYHRYKQPRRARSAPARGRAMMATLAPWRCWAAVAAALAAAGGAGGAGRGLGALLHRWPARAGASRCATSSCACPSWPPGAPAPGARALRLAGRSLLERGLLWYASAERLSDADPRRGRHRPGRAQRPRR